MLAWGMPRQREESIMETKNSAQVQANIPNASLSSYEPVKISLADAPSAESELLEELGKDPAQLEALSIAVMRFAHIRRRRNGTV